jgi:tetratricopeptide (TPR) repeat protein
MHTIKIAGLLAAGIVFAGAANAQVPRGLERSGAGAEASMAQQGLDAVSDKFYRDGVAAMQARNFQVAEGIFDEVLRRNPTHAEGNLMMGTTKMSLGKWEEAKEYLEVAVKKNPKSPDPKSRLGVTLIKLGDIDGAMKQRADIEKMDKDCKGKCRNAEWIAGGLAMIDGAMPKP